MAADLPITDLLHQIQQGDRATTDIYDYFIGQARSLAKSRLGSKLQRKVSISSIALDAFDECIRHAKKSGTLESREDFSKMLAYQVSLKISDAAKRFGTKKRDTDKEVGTHDSGETDHRDFGPEAKAVADELAVKIVQNIFSEPNESKRAICLLGILLKYPANLIQEMIEPLDDRVGDNGESAKSQYAISTIQLAIRQRRLKLYEEFGPHDDRTGEGHDQSAE